MPDKLKNEIEQNAAEYESSSSGFEELIKNILNDNIYINKLSFRIKSSGAKSQNSFNPPSITEEYCKQIKNKVLKVKEHIELTKFKSFKKAYKSVHLIQKNILENASNIKNQNKDMFYDIGSFLLNNGIILLVEENPNNDFKCVDGFACFLGEYPVIVLYEPSNKQRKRMLFTIAHEIYHLLYDEKEDIADKFAGALLLTNDDIHRILNEDQFKTMEQLKKEYSILISEKKYHEIKNLIELKLKDILILLYKKTGISVRPIVKRLLESDKLPGKEYDYKDIISSVGKSNFESHSPNIKSTEDIVLSK